MEVNRSKLPFRMNCEGYFVDNKGNILAKYNKKGFLEFPGGGIDDNETVESAILRETFEETGAIITDLKKIGELKFIWGENWAKTDKQKKRYKNYIGEDMSFFSGIIYRFKIPKEKDDGFWKGKKLLSIKEAIKIIENDIPFDNDIVQYRNMQLKFLKQIENEKI